MAQTESPSQISIISHLSIMNTQIRKYPDGSQYSEYVISSKDSALTVDPQGAYVTSWKKAGQDILYSGSSKKRTGIPLLFPYFGQSKMGRQHGFGRDSTWNVSNQTSSSISLLLTDHNIDKKALAEYPYEFSATVTVSIDEAGSVTYELVITNPSGQPLPISPGLHPYWAVEHEKKNIVQSVGIDAFDASKIDWSGNPPDTDYPFSHRIALNFPHFILDIVDISNPPAVKQTTVWSQTPDKADCHFICFEPVCGVRGGIDTSPIMVVAGQTWNMKLQMSVN